MGMQINTNVSALNAYRNLSSTQNDLSKSLEKLSSGLRINRAADDAAGLAISEGLRSQVNGLNVAARNAQDGISVIQTAEGALTEVHSILQRMRDLAVQAGNDSNNPKSRDAITKEATQLSAELKRIGDSTNFNGIKLLDGSANLSFQVGANGEAASRIGVNLTGANVTGIANSLTVGASGTSFAVATPTLVTGAQSFAVTNTDGSTSTVGVTLGTAGTYNTVQDVADALNSSDSFSAVLSASVDSTNQLVVTSLNGGSVAVTAPGTGLAAGTPGSAGALNFTTSGGAANAITLLDAQIESVSSARADLGAIQNRFESTINSLKVSAENLSAAESRIRETDMASEMVKFTAKNILSQAGTAMLAQANQSTQGVLQLLR
ncbi:flagellin N-terminal helical domain-containing protein [Microbacterium sp. nov. GSS16]|uniref:flagellin N-terminal helical domain-containing protein n=1 Tax=Microbacterium sp. nov. GSS16 TaxID=3019890 RepID=UPI00230524F5|nr:flagellin [Microbacterium sp. nov. GSS16]WCD92847.1 flagellin [Microbacterium sp. nov. GSS16]